ncbi:MAG: hypothetical protein DYG92_05820 [Leptolyngbya sp. PLA1]|nr:hypothetical protein [Leptolyngbya sp. PLA1]
MPDNTGDFWGKGSGQPPEESGLRDKKNDAGTGFYAKGGGEEPAKPAGGFWTKAEDRRQQDQKERDELLKDPHRPTRKKRRIVRNIILGLVCALVLLGVVGGALGPTIAGAIAPGYIRGMSGTTIAGKIDVEDVDLSWAGPQSVSGFSLRGADGALIAKGSVTTDATLWSLITGPKDLGEITLSGGTLALIREADGSLNVQTATSPPGKSGTKPPSTPTTKGVGEQAKPTLPPGLKAKIAVKNLDATFTDKSAADAATVTLEDADLNAEVEVGHKAKVRLESTAYVGTTRPDSGAGRLAVNATVDRWSTPEGTLTLDKAKGEADVTLASFPVHVVDTLLGPVGRTADGAAVTLRGSLGPALDLSLVASGDGKAANITFGLSLDGARAAGEAAIADGVLSLTKPLELSAKGAAIRALLPRTEQYFAPGASPSLDAIPDTSVVVERLKLPYDAAGPDLRKLDAAVRVSVAPGSGRVVIEQGKPPSVFTTTPLTLSLDTTSLGTSVRVQAGTSATLAGNPAGEIRVDATLGGLIDAAGKFAAMPASIEGAATVKGAATAILQPLVAGLDIDLYNDVGPTVDLSVRASASGATPAQGDRPIAIDATFRSAGVSADAALELSESAIRARDPGIRADVPGAGAIASRFVKPASGWSLTPAPGGGRAVLQVQRLAIPRSPAGLELDRAEFKGTLDLTGLSLMAIDTSGSTRAGVSGPVSLASTRVVADLSQGSAKVDLAGSATYDGAPFSLAARFDLPGLLRATTTGGVRVLEIAPPLSLRPAGTLLAKDVPPTLARAVMPRGEGPLDTPALVSQALGGPTTIEVTTKPAPENAVDVTLAVRSAKVAADLGGVVEPAGVTLRQTVAGIEVTPALLETLLAAYAPSMAQGGGGSLSLVGPARVRATLEPITIPLTAESTPALDRIGTATLTVTLAEKTQVDGLSVADEGGTRRPLGRVGVEGLSLRAAVPVGALTAPALVGQRAVRVDVTGGLLGNQGTLIAALTGSMAGEISEGRLAGPLTTTASLERVSTADAEKLAGLEGLLTGLLGDTAQVRTSVTLTPPQGGTVALADADFDAELAVSAPRLRSDAPLRVRRAADRTSLVQPAKLTIQPDVATVNRFLAGPEGKGMKLQQSGPITLDIASIVLPRPTPGTPSVVRPSLAVSLALPSASFAGADAQTIRIGGLALAVSTPPPAPGERPSASQPVELRLLLAEAAVGDTPPARDMAITGTLSHLFSPEGALEPDKARLTVRGDLPALPTALVDVLANRKGALVEGLGPTVAVRIDADRVPITSSADVSREQPTLRVTLTSPRASAEIMGVFGNGTFTAQQPVRVSVSEVTRLFADRFLGMTPLLGALEKTRDDAPAMLTATGLVAPLDGDMRKLNGDVTIDPGQCRFETAGLFSSVLKNLGQRTAGAAGTRLEPLAIQVRSGVATYGPWRVPVGEFSMILQADQDSMSRGIDLNAKQIDMVVWIPAGALADKAAGQLNTGLGSLLSRAPVLDALTLTPWRVKGPLDKPGVSLDSELWAKTAVKKLSPEGLLRGGLKDLLKPK